MLMACTFDTNILVYTLPNPANTKREQARNLLIRGARDSANVLLLQALAEFSYVAARKFALNAASIRRRVDDWHAAIPVHIAEEGDLSAALLVVENHRIGFWDALMCATAERVGMSHMLTEDLQDGRRLGSLTIVNPFRPENSRLIDRILPP
jgi:predicted nucleic acid-binding protein